MSFDKHAYNFAATLGIKAAQTTAPTPTRGIGEAPQSLDTAPTPLDTTPPNAARWGAAAGNTLDAQSDTLQGDDTRYPVPGANPRSYRPVAGFIGGGTTDTTSYINPAYINQGAQSTSPTTVQRLLRGIDGTPVNSPGTFPGSNAPQPNQPQQAQVPPNQRPNPPNIQGLGQSGLVPINGTGGANPSPVRPTPRPPVRPTIRPR